MKRIIVLLLIAMQLISMCALAETVRPSITVSQMLIPVGDVTVGEEFVVALLAIGEETEEKMLFDEIASFVLEAPIATYFGEEVMTTAAVYLPEGFDANTLVMDEFFVLTEENYEEIYGDVAATFEFITPYEDDTVLIAMVGVLPAEVTDEATEEAAITWIPLQAVVTEGKVQISFTQEIFEMLKENKCVFALLRENTIETVA